MRTRRLIRFSLTGLIVMWLILGLTMLAVAYSDSGTVNVIVPNDTQSKIDIQTAAGAFVSYFGDNDVNFGSSGTGTFEPFVRLQHTPTEQGYNTNATVGSTATDPVLHDVTAGKWTHAILVSHIPQRPCPTVNPTPPPDVGSLSCFELWVDINESNSAPYVSLNKVEVYFTSNASLTGYPFGANATLQYSFAGDILIHDVNAGSGRADLRYDIPINLPGSAINIPSNCNYGNPSCTTYFVLYSQWGTTPGPAPDGKTFSSDGGFEEWKVKSYPAISLTKTPNVTDVCNGSNTSVTYTYVVTNNSFGNVDVSGSVVDNNGTPSDTTDDVTVGTFSGLAAGASQTFTHVFTVNATRTNIATATATDPDGNTATASATVTVTGHVCTISITKVTTTPNICSGSTASYTIVVTNNSDFFSWTGSVIDDKLGTLDATLTLGVGGSKTYNITTGALTADQTNTVTADGKFDDPAKTSATQTASASVKVHTCSISITKVTTTPNICSGSTASYTIVVTNNSDFYSWTGSVIDDKLGTLDATLTLGVGGSKTYNITTGALTANQTNTVTADGKFDDPAKTSATQTASASVKVHVCSISITKVPSKDTVCNGSSVTYTIVVTNNSDAFAWTGSVIDNVLGTLASSVTIPVGGQVTYTPSGTINGTVTNTVTADGKFNDSASTSASATASATVTGQNCSQITPTETTCSDFASGTAATLSLLQYTVKDDLTNSISPGVFFYWVGFVASPGSNTFTIHQTITTGNFDSHFFSYAAGSNAFDKNCSSLGATITQSGPDVTVTFNAGSGGKVYLGIKFDSTSVKGFTPPSGNGTAHYSFETVGLAGSTQGLDLSQK